MKKLIVLIVMTLLPAALMVGCSSSSNPSSSGGSNATPTATIVPVGPTALSLGVADSSGPGGTFAGLAYTTITNTGESVAGNLGLNTGTSSGGSIIFTLPAPSNNNYTSTTDPHGYTAAAQASVFGTTGAYNTALLYTPTPLANAELGGQTLPPGVYSPGVSATSFTLSSNFILNNTGGNPNNAYIFVTGASGTLNTSSLAQMTLQNVKASNVFWVVTSSVTLANGAPTLTNPTPFVGTILAYTSITFNSGAWLDGHAFCETGALAFTGTNTITNTP